MKELMDLSNLDSPALIIPAELTGNNQRKYNQCAYKFNHTMNRLHFKHYLTMHQFIIDNQIDKLKECYIEREAINCGEWNLYWRG